MGTTGAETNVPLLVAGVFAATFLVVGAIAYLILFRQVPRQATAPRDEVAAAGSAAEDHRSDGHQPEPAPQFLLPLDEPQPESPPAPSWESVAVRVEPPPEAQPESPAQDSQRLLVHLYRALMLTTGIAGLVASALMFSAVEGLSLLPVVAILIAAFSVYSIYRGFVPDTELRRPRRRQ